MKRPYISVKTKVSVAIEQAMTIPCPICWFPLTANDDRVLEHMVPHRLGGSSEVENLRWVHKACAAKKTNGTKATSAGGDLHKIAKAKRLEKARAAHEAIVSGTAEKPPGKIKSAGFNKTWRKRMNGQVEKRS